MGVAVMLNKNNPNEVTANDIKQEAKLCRQMAIHALENDDTKTARMEMKNHFNALSAYYTKRAEKFLGPVVSV